MLEDRRDRAIDKVERLTRQPDDLVAMWRGATEVLADVVPHHLSPCWYTVDPASLLITSHFQEELAEFPREWLATEYATDDVNHIADVARSRTGLATLHEATGGRPSSSPRWHANMSMGGDQELIASLRTRSGDVWGSLGLYREPGRPLFDDADKRFIAALAPLLAEGARRALLVGEAREPDGDDAPGLLVLDDTWAVESTTPGVDRWLLDLPDGAAGRLPSAVLAVAGRALRTADRPGLPGEVAASRVRSRSGTWVLLHAACLSSTTTVRRVAVIIEPAPPTRLSVLLMAAYGLTGRERDVTRLVLGGASTAEIADELVVSPNTVQQHLKSIFDKTGVRSRRDLVGKVFFAHYEPRLRDNERRAAGGRALRGGPMPVQRSQLPSPAGGQR